MKDKIKKAIKKNRKYYLMFFILWLLLVIVFVAPLSCSIVEGTVNSNSNGKEIFSFQEFILAIGKNIKTPFQCIGNSFKEIYIQTFSKTLLYFSGIYLLIVIIGILKSAPKTEYADIEHGSSDWSENGEQYRVLNKKEGIILAEDNYLPLNKMGNINVLIVGRIRFW